VVDRSPEMLSRAASKGLETVRADAQRLPFVGETFDAALMISMLHHVEDRGAALAEARRILKLGGRLVLRGSRVRTPRRSGSSTASPAAGPGWRTLAHRGRRFSKSCPARASSSLSSTSRTCTTPRWLRSRPIPSGWLRRETGATSYFERMQRDHPDELRAGLGRLREDIAASCAPRHGGTATVLSWTKPS
jgi:SAM-dependent methyltransferase